MQITAGDLSSRLHYKELPCGERTCDVEQLQHRSGPLVEHLRILVIWPCDAMAKPVSKLDQGVDCRSSFRREDVRHVSNPAQPRFLAGSIPEKFKPRTKG